MNLEFCYFHIWFDLYHRKGNGVWQLLLDERNCWNSIFAWYQPWWCVALAFLINLLFLWDCRVVFFLFHFQTKMEIVWFFFGFIFMVNAGWAEKCVWILQQKERKLNNFFGIKFLFEYFYWITNWVFNMMLSETKLSHHLDNIREMLYTKQKAKSKNVKHTVSVNKSAVNRHILFIIPHVISSIVPCYT